VAGAASVVPPTTFLTEAGKEEPAEGGKSAEGVEAPAGFDAAAIKLPEGVEISDEALQSFVGILDNPDLSSQERGEQLFAMHTAALQELHASLAGQVTEANKTAYEKMNTDWRAAITELPEFKENPDAEAGKIMQVAVSLGAGEDFFKALDLTGAGNNPAILQIFHRMAQPFLEGGAVGGGGKASPPKQLGANMYTSTTRT
jgi:hypothetical protein